EHGEEPARRAAGDDERAAAGARTLAARQSAAGDRGQPDPAPDLLPVDLPLPLDGLGGAQVERRDLRRAESDPERDSVEQLRAGLERGADRALLPQHRCHHRRLGGDRRRHHRDDRLRPGALPLPRQEARRRLLRRHRLPTGGLHRHPGLRADQPAGAGRHPLGGDPRRGGRGARRHHPPLRRILRSATEGTGRGGADGRGRLPAHLLPDHAAALDAGDRHGDHPAIPALLERLPPAAGADPLAARAADPGGRHLLLPRRVLHRLGGDLRGGDDQHPADHRGLPLPAALLRPGHRRRREAV
ncbi:MAG: ABC transporter, permease protein 2 (cluster 1, maltose/g3p/polyamine/iron), partial [uncultured Thermomicrobiales bacterium]